MRFIAALVSLAFVMGCSQPNLEEPAAGEGNLFGPAAMRIHPIFTQVKDWNRDGDPDGVEALVEFQDQFGDPTKAAGTVMFELYEYRQGDAEPRGQRLSNPWIGSIVTLNEQRARWNRTSRTYTFQLAYPSISNSRSYVLSAVFRSNTGGRFFDRVVLEGQEEGVAPTSRPATQPGAGIHKP
jgi:hypothetical protein